MAVYVSADLHGMKLFDFQRLLERAGFSDGDTLYILGDVIDRRNDGGIELLCWIMKQRNITMLLGNHEDMLCGCEFALGEVSDDSISGINVKSMSMLKNYLNNGGDVTVEALNAAGDKKTKLVMDYLWSLPLYKEIEIKDKKYVLVHAGLGGFAPSKKLSEYSKFDLIWTRPSYCDRYYEDKTVIFGHTPTVYYGSEFAGKILHRPTWIDIDTGAAYGKDAAVLRLDDMNEFYF